MKDIGEAFSFPFKDPNWIVKFLIGAIFIALSVVLIGIPAVTGYYIELVQRVRRKEQYPLPDWKDVGVKFLVGIKYIVAIAIYYLPIMIVIFPIVVLFALAMIQNPYWGESVESGGLVLILVLVIVLYSLFIAVLTPIIATQFAERESIGDAVRVTRISSLFGRHWQDALLAALIGAGVHVLSCIGVIFFLVGMLVTSFYASLVTYHLYGQIAQDIAGSDLPPVPSTP